MVLPAWPHTHTHTRAPDKAVGAPWGGVCLHTTLRVAASAEETGARGTHGNCEGGVLFRGGGGPRLPSAPPPRAPCFRHTTPCPFLQAIVGNKADLPPSSRAVTREEGAALAREYGVPFFEASAKTGAGVDDAFTHVARAVVARADAAPGGAWPPTSAGGGGRAAEWGRGRGGARQGGVLRVVRKVNGPHTQHTRAMPPPPPPLLLKDSASFFFRHFFSNTQSVAFFASPPQTNSPSTPLSLHCVALRSSPTGAPHSAAHGPATGWLTTARGERRPAAAPLPPLATTAVPPLPPLPWGWLVSLARGWLPSLAGGWLLPSPALPPSGADPLPPPPPRLAGSSRANRAAGNPVRPEGGAGGTEEASTRGVAPGAAPAHGVQGDASHPPPPLPDGGLSAAVPGGCVGSSWDGSWVGGGGGGGGTRSPSPLPPLPDARRARLAAGEEDPACETRGAVVVAAPSAGDGGDGPRRERGRAAGAAAAAAAAAAGGPLSPDSQKPRSSSTDASGPRPARGPRAATAAAREASSLSTLASRRLESASPPAAVPTPAAASSAAVAAWASASRASWWEADASASCARVKAPW